MPVKYGKLVTPEEIEKIKEAKRRNVEKMHRIAGARGEKERDCAYCGVKMVTKNGGRKTCSNRCRLGMSMVRKARNELLEEEMATRGYRVERANGEAVARGSG
jgi:hypothetical protein